MFNSQSTSFSADALWEKYPGWSPYQYSLNNPINLLDWNGKNYYLQGTQTSAALDDLNKEMPGASFTIDEEGELIMEGEYVPKNELESSFIKNMSDANIDVNLMTMNDVGILSQGENFLFLPGAYLGAAANSSTGKIDGNMAMNIEFSERHELVGGTSSGINIIHELLEGFYGAEQNGVHKPSDDTQLKAHNSVMILDKIQNDGVFYGPGSTGSINYYHVTGSKGTMLLFNSTSFEIFPRKLQ